MSKSKRTELVNDLVQRVLNLLPDPKAVNPQHTYTFYLTGNQCRNLRRLALEVRESVEKE